MRNPADDARGLSFGRSEEPGGMPFIVFALDAEGVFTASDGEGLAALGLEPGEVVGRERVGDRTARELLERCEGSYFLVQGE